MEIVGLCAVRSMCTGDDPVSMEVAFVVDIPQVPGEEMKKEDRITLEWRRGK